MNTEKMKTCPVCGIRKYRNGHKGYGEGKSSAVALWYAHVRGCVEFAKKYGDYPRCACGKTPADFKSKSGFSNHYRACKGNKEAADTKPAAAVEAPRTMQGILDLGPGSEYPACPVCKKPKTIETGKQWNKHVWDCKRKFCKDHELPKPTKEYKKIRDKLSTPPMRLVPVDPKPKKSEKFKPEPGMAALRIKPMLEDLVVEYLRHIFEPDSLIGCMMPKTVKVAVDEMSIEDVQSAFWMIHDAIFPVQAK